MKPLHERLADAIDSGASGYSLLAEVAALEAENERLRGEVEHLTELVGSWAQRQAEAAKQRDHHRETLRLMAQWVDPVCACPMCGAQPWVNIDCPMCDYMDRHPLREREPWMFE